MTRESIKKHFARYKIYQKRCTTINHAFASAMAPSDDYSPERVDTLLAELDCLRDGRIVCVYCGSHEAQTWDHLRALVRASRPSGHGHTYGNLVPSCKDCNSTKGNKDGSEANRLINAKNPEQAARVDRLISRHLATHPTGDRSVSPDLVAALDDLKAQILDLMRKADELIDRHRT